MKGFVDTSLIMKAVLSKENGLRKSAQISHVAVMEVPGEPFPLKRQKCGIIHCPSDGRFRRRRHTTDLRIAS